MKITRKSQFTGRTHTMDLPTVTQERLNECWSQCPTGTRHIQDVFPELSADEREFLITGATPEEWDEMFGKHEDVD